MKSKSKATEAKKTLNSSTRSCLYWKKSGCKEDICYYKYPKQANEGFCEQFKGRIADLKSCNQLSVKSPQDQETETPNNDRLQRYMV